jgi:hypothetical protein
MEGAFPLDCYLSGGPVCTNVECHVYWVVDWCGCPPCPGRRWSYLKSLGDEGVCFIRVDDIDFVSCVFCWVLLVV